MQTKKDILETAIRSSLSMQEVQRLAVRAGVSISQSDLLEARNNAKKDYDLYNKRGY